MVQHHGQFAGDTLIFVYGSLLTGESHHSMMKGAVFHGPGHTRAEFDLVDFGEYPALVPGGNTRVCGEVYEVDRSLLMSLDEHEDHPEYYRRTRLTLEDGQVVEAYLLSRAQANGFPRIESGRWRERQGAPAGVPEESPTETPAG